MSVASSVTQRRQNYNISGSLNINGSAKIGNKEIATLDEIKKLFNKSYYPGEYPGYNGHGWDNMSVISSFANNSLYGICVDIKDGTLWGTKGDTHEVVHLNRDGSLITSIIPAVGGSVYGITLDMANGSLWFVDNLNSNIYHIAQDGSQINYFASPAINPTGISIDKADGTLWVVAENTIYHLTQDGTTINNFAAPNNATDIAIDHFDGTLYVTNNGNITYHLDRTGLEIEQYSFGTSIKGIDVDPANGNLWIVETFEGNVYYLV